MSNNKRGKGMALISIKEAIKKYPKEKVLNGIKDGKLNRYKVSQQLDISGTGGRLPRPDKIDSIVQEQYINEEDLKSFIAEER